MAEQRTAIVIGATGIVGTGIVRALAQGAWRVIGIARNAGRLNHLRDLGMASAVLAGSVDSDENAVNLALRVKEIAPRIDAVVTSISLPRVSKRLLDTTADELVETIRGDLVSHHCAARAFVPLLAPGGRYVGIGGGMADLTFAGLGPVSICQAAQRNMFRFYALEMAALGVSVVELILVSMIVGSADDATADPRQLRADEVGTHVRATLEQADRFPGPILTLKSRKQVGQPEDQT